jgi:formylglycine-generating enzyme required for sulfatase activity
VSRAHATPLLGFKRFPVLGEWLLLLTLGVLPTLLALTSPAAQAAPDKRVALLIGNAKYTSGLPPLSNPPKDTATLEASLKKLNFSVQRITDGDQKAMGRAIKQFGTDAQDAQVAFFYYSGHGMQARDENYLIPIAAQIQSEAELDGEAIKLRGVLRQIEDASPQNAIVVLDACRDNPVASRSKNASKGLSRVQSQPGNTYVVFAAQAGTTASDNGVFAKALAQHITEPNVGMRVVFDNVSKAVKKASGNKQSIQRDDRLDQDIVLLASVGVVPAGQSSQTNTNAQQPSQAPVQRADPEEEAWELTKRTHSASAYQAYLNRYPQGRFIDTARMALEGLQPTTVASSITPAPQPQPSPQPTLQPSPTPAPQPIVSNTTQPGQVFKDCADCPEMVVIPAGSFTMGSNEKATEQPIHSVTLRSFAAGKYAVTKGQFAAFVQAKGYRTEAEQSEGCSVWTGGKWEKQTDKNWRNVGFAQGDDHPVVCVSWNDAQAYAQWLSQTTGKAYRLLSEAEREYAARAGTSSKYWWGDTASHEYANYGTDQCCGPLAQGRDQWEFTAPVGQFPANGFGLHDMHGNTWDWVQDVWHDNYSGAPSDGSAWTSGGDQTRRVLRGGSWDGSPDILRSVNRGRITPFNRDVNYGFRIARTVP